MASGPIKQKQLVVLSVQTTITIPANAGKRLNVDMLKQGYKFITIISVDTSSNNIVPYAIYPSGIALSNLVATAQTQTITIYGLYQTL